MTVTVRRALAACALLVASPVLAQPAPSGTPDRPTSTGAGSPVSGSPSVVPGGTQGKPETSLPHAAATPAGSGPGASLSAPGAGEWLAGKLVGTTVVSANNETVGDVSDVVVDRDGRVRAVVVGVGGFLGVGEKGVAVPFEQVQFSSRGTAPTPAASQGGNGSGTAARNPERVTIRMTRQELQAAPEFKAADAGPNATGTAPGTKR